MLYAIQVLDLPSTSPHAKVEKFREASKIQLGLNLLHYLKDIYWTETEIEMALEKIRAESDDLMLDFPKIQELTTTLVMKAREQGLITEQTQYRDSQNLV